MARKSFRDRDGLTTTERKKKLLAARKKLSKAVDKVFSQALHGQEKFNDIKERLKSDNPDVMAVEKLRDEVQTHEIILQNNHGIDTRYLSNPKARTMKKTTRKTSPAQLAARKLFAERARAGTLKKGTRKKAARKTNPARKRNPERVTRDWLEKRITLLNRQLGRPVEPWTKNADGKFRANIGNLHFDSHSGGLQIDEIMSDGGGVNTIGGRYKPKEMDTFLTGLLSGVDLALHRKRNPRKRAKPPGRAKATRKTNPVNYYQIFKCKGNEVYWLRGFTADTSEPRFTLTRGDAARYESLKQAKFITGAFEILRGWKVGIAKKGTSLDKIVSTCKGKA